MIRNLVIIGKVKERIDWDYKQKRKERRGREGDLSYLMFDYRKLPHYHYSSLSVYLAALLRAITQRP